MRMVVVANELELDDVCSIVEIDSPQALQMLLPSSSLRQSGVVVVPQLQQVSGPGPVELEPNFVSFSASKPSSTLDGVHAAEFAPL